jgi:hypothetical protein
MSDTTFLVYEHWRPDTDACFYVGKGKRKRARSFEARNSRYQRIVAKLDRLGYVPKIKIVRDNLTEQQAFDLEIAMIDYWRSRGFSIANFTNGGDGASGYLHTEETKMIIRKKRSGQKWSPEQHEKRRNQTRPPHSEKTKAKMSASAKIAQKARFDKVKKTAKGRAELCKRMMRISRNAACNPELRARRSANAKALWSDPHYQEKMRNRRMNRLVVPGFS